MDKILSQKTIKTLLSLQNVVGIGYGLKQINGHLTQDEAIVVLVKTKVPLNQLPEKQVIPTTIEGKLSDVLEVGEISVQDSVPHHGNIVEAYNRVEDLVARTSRWRPAPGGVSIGHYQITAGTLGTVVYDRDSGTKLILSNNHVLANSTNGHDNRAKKGDPILQPGPIDGGTLNQDTIAKLYKFVPLNDTGLNLVDAAVAKPLKSHYVAPFIIGIGLVNGIILPKVGMSVKKSGRTTGLTHGTILATNAIVNVDYGGGRILTFRDQILTTAMSAGGDSGSLVLNEDNWAVGLLFAGSATITIINPITTVLDMLDVSFFKES